MGHKTNPVRLLDQMCISYEYDRRGSSVGCAASKTWRTEVLRLRYGLAIRVRLMHSVTTWRSLALEVSSGTPSSKNPIG